MDREELLTELEIIQEIAAVGHSPEQRIRSLVERIRNEDDDEAERVVAHRSESLSHGLLFEVWQNSDLTEGKGHMRRIATYADPRDALERARFGGVMGVGNAEVRAHFEKGEAAIRPTYSFEGKLNPHTYSTYQDKEYFAYHLTHDHLFGTAIITKNYANDEDAVNVYSEAQLMFIHAALHWYEDELGEWIISERR